MPELDHAPLPQNRAVAQRTKARLVERPDGPFHFKGLPDYISRVADATGLDSPDLRARAASGWAVDAVGAGLSQVVERARDGRLAHSPGLARETFARLGSILDVMDVQRAALAAAIADVAAVVGDEGGPAARAVDDRKPLKGAPRPPRSTDPDRPGAHRVDRPGPPTERSTAVSDREKDETPTPPPTDETGRVLDDIDGDGDVEPVIHPGVGEPTGPPAETQPIGVSKEDVEKEAGKVVKAAEAEVKAEKDAKAAKDKPKGK